MRSDSRRGPEYGGQDPQDAGTEMYGLYGHPTYILGMADSARNRLGIDPAKDLHIQRIMGAGEPGACIPTTKKRIEEAWGAKVYDHIGLTEVGSWSYECTEQPGGQHVLEAFFLVEIEDMETGEIIDEPGRNGKMIITSFDRLAKPSIRFDTKDVIRWADYDCSCGRTFRLIDGGIVGRADDILLKVEMAPGKEGEEESILSRLRDQLRVKTNLGYRIENHPYGSLPRYEIKAKRFKDLRKKGGSNE